MSVIKLSRFDWCFGLRPGFCTPDVTGWEPEWRHILYGHELSEEKNTNNEQFNFLFTAKNSQIFIQCGEKKIILYSF